ncbi:MAG: hypothetical protein J6R10_01185 [Tidjanibacter sp.]|nr:hypothetical protein [Tidjanibacter sp.]
MRYTARIAFLTIIGVALLGCRSGEDVLEPTAPIIKAQSITNGTKNVAIDIPFINIIFDRTIEFGDESALTLLPEATMEPTIIDSSLRIILPEGLEYDTDYVLTIGAGVVKDKLTGGGNFERIIAFTTEEAPYSPPSEPSLKLVCANPTVEAQNLYDYMWALYGRSTLSGVMSDNMWQAKERDWIERWTGNTPAVTVFNYNYLHRSPSNVFDYTNIKPIGEWSSRGGIVAIDWLWMVPDAEGSRKYYCEIDLTTVRVKNMLTEGTWENELMKADLEEVANMLLLLQERNIPVLWRPLPEAAGNSYSQSGGKAKYWWGANGAEPFKQLWRTMYDYFAERGVRNLIWVWTTQTYDLEYYPGDRYVDMISFDMYNRGSIQSISSLWAYINKYYPHKMVAMSELGNVVYIPQHLDADVTWSYFVTATDTANDFSENFPHAYATISWWNTVFADERIVTLRNLPQFNSEQ